MKDFEKLVRDIIEYDPDAHNIHHLLSVHQYAVLIAQMEKVDESVLETVELCAYLHDIGIKESRRKHSDSLPVHQMEEGPAVARGLLSHFDVDSDVVERVCFIIAHHHIYDDVDGVDFQILVEADCIVNLMEGFCRKESIPFMRESVFKTQAGLFLLDNMKESLK